MIKITQYCWSPKSRVPWIQVEDVCDNSVQIVCKFHFCFMIPIKLASGLDVITARFEIVVS